MDELHHECGVAALYYLPNRADRSAVWTGDPDQVSRHMPRMLLDLQNRGQLAAGMATFNPARGKLLANYKEIGTVIEAFRMNDPAKYASIMEDFAGRAAIGHTRYATCGPTHRSYAQPFEHPHRPVAPAGPPGQHPRRRAERPPVRRPAPPGPLLLRVDLLRQRLQHPRRPQRLPIAGEARPGTGEAGEGPRPGAAGPRGDGGR